MKKTAIALAISTVFVATLAACSSISKPSVPSGWSREPINKPANQATPGEMAAPPQNGLMRELERQLDAAKKQIADLKASVTFLQKENESLSAQKQPVITPAAAEVEKEEAAPLAAQQPSGRMAAGRIKVISNEEFQSARESIEIRDQSVIFRVSEAAGKTEFVASSDLQERLIKAAREASSIEIRGRTDAPIGTPASRDIALQRAMHAKAFLVSNGITSTKIRIFILAAGGHVADNTTAEGRAKNRRVEVEAKGINTAPLQGK